MKPFLFGALAVVAGLLVFMVGTFGTDFAFLKSGMGPSLTGGAISLRQYSIPTAYRFAFAALAAFLAVRLSLGRTSAPATVIVLALLVVLLEIGGQMELKDRVPSLWKVLALASLVAAFAVGTTLGYPRLAR